MRQIVTVSIVLAMLNGCDRSELAARSAIESIQEATKLSFADQWNLCSKRGGSIKTCVENAGWLETMEGGYIDKHLAVAFLDQGIACHNKSNYGTVEYDNNEQKRCLNEAGWRYTNNAEWIR